MKSAFEALGQIIYWFLWPFWIIYFKFSPLRGRVLLVCGGEVLLVKGWVGDGQWALPGGGVKKGEQPAAAAARELKEETGISLSEASFELLGFYDHKKHGIFYRSMIFMAETKHQSFLKASRPELLEAAWVPLDKTQNIKLAEDASYALDLIHQGKV